MFDNKVTEFSWKDRIDSENSGKWRDFYHFPGSWYDAVSAAFEAPANIKAPETRWFFFLESAMFEVKQYAVVDASGNMLPGYPKQLDHWNIPN